MSEPSHFRKGSKIWWDLTRSKTRPAWVMKTKTFQAGEVVDIEGDMAVIEIMNEVRKMETYMVPIDLLRHREIM